MKPAGTAVLVTGASRGLGNALVEKPLRRGAKRVYAAARQPFAQPDWRVIPLILEVTIAPQIEAVRKKVESLDIVINNAGITLYDNRDRAAMGQQLAVGLFGTYDVTRAFLPLLAVRGEPSSMFYRWPSWQARLAKARLGFR